MERNRKAVAVCYTFNMQKRILNYRIIIEPETYDDGSTVYVGYCPSLGVSDYGDTVEDVMRSIRDGIYLAVESLAKEKKEIPVDNIEQQIITSAAISTSHTGVFASA